jgi:hypothetical protein
MHGALDAHNFWIFLATSVSNSNISILPSKRINQSSILLYISGSCANKAPNYSSICALGKVFYAISLFFPTSRAGEYEASKT